MSYGASCRAIALVLLGACGRVNFDDRPIDAALPDAGPPTRSTYIKASNPDPMDAFGFAIALSTDGSTLAVGAPGEGSINGMESNNDTPNAGAVYIFVRSGDTWAQQAYIKPANPDPDDRFGESVALSADGSVLAVGAHGEASGASGIGGDQTDDSVGGAGAVFTYRRTGSTWAFDQYFKAAAPDLSDRFGWTVALSGDGATLVVGMIHDDSNATGIGGNQTDDSVNNAGSVYVFTRAATWSQTAYLKASNTGANDRLGCALSLTPDGSWLAVGAFGEASNARGVNGDQTNDTMIDSGAVYVFHKTATWAQDAYIKASNTDARDQFGWSVSLTDDGQLLAIGSPLEASSASGVGGNQADNSATDAGAVYMFSRSSGAWQQTEYIKASNPDPVDDFGRSVVLSATGTRLVTNALTEDSAAVGFDGNQADDSVNGAGAVYIFDRAGDSWAQTSYVKATNTGVLDLFGWSIALAGTGTIAASARGEASNAAGIDGDQANNAKPNAGAVYVIE